MKLNKIILGIIILSIIGTLVAYPYLPATVPSHWGISGEIDAYAGKEIVFFTALLPLVMYGFMFLAPRIDPKKENYKAHMKAYSTITLAIIAFLVLIHWSTIGINIYKGIDVVFCIRATMGVLFIIIGNYMTQLRFNYFVGVRTPWSLADEGVWKKTNRFGGYAFMLMGLMTILTLFFSHTMGLIVIIGGVLLLVPGSFAYSYLEYQKVKSSDESKKE